MASAVEVSTPARGALAGYAARAGVLRLGDAGAGLGVVLLAVDSHGARGATVGGLLAAAITAPHVLGARVGPLVDRHADPRRPLALLCAAYAVGLALGCLLVPTAYAWWAALPLLVAGACGPALTGGLSFLSVRVDAGSRARSWDALTYGLAGCVGPAAVGALAPLLGVLTVMLGLAALVLLAGLSLLGLRLPAPGVDHEESASPRVRLPLLTIRPLRRVTLTTLVTAATAGALSVCAVLIGDRLTGSAAAGAWVLAALGVGNLLGSLVVVARPLAREPVRVALVLAAVLALAHAAVGWAGTFGLAVVAAAVVGAVTAVWVTATLSARERYAPAGQAGEVFSAMAGWKIGAASAGTALAGVLSAAGPRVVLGAAAALSLAVVLAATLDRPRVE